MTDSGSGVISEVRLDTCQSLEPVPMSVLRWMDWCLSPVIEEAS